MAGTDKAQEQDKSSDHLLAEAERKIRRFEAKVSEQKATIREMRAQARHEDNLAEQGAALKLEISELKAELREITRANHEYVARFEALRNGGPRMAGKAKTATGVPAGFVPRLAAE